MAAKLVAILDARAESVAVVARVGSDLSRWRFEADVPRFTHVGFAVRAGSCWWIDHLLNTAEGAFGQLYRQPPIHFFRDDPFEYRAFVLVPSRSLQRLLAPRGGDARRALVHLRKYRSVLWKSVGRSDGLDAWPESEGAAGTKPPSRVTAAP
jgi:hypothetical protein